MLPKVRGSDRIEDRVSPPYDVIDEKQLAALKSKPFNITRITLGGEDGDYSNAAGLLNSWIRSEKLREDDADAFYIMRQEFAHGGRRHVRTGIMGALGLQTYEAGNISPHEETFPKIKEDRLNLLRATEAHLESIFCLYDRLDPKVLEAVASQATMLFEVTDDLGTRHWFGRVSDPELVSTIRSELAKKKLLIADGHHRYETALRYSSEHPEDAKKGYVLATLVAGNDPGLIVLPTHRLFTGIQINTEEFLFHASKFFAIWEVQTMEELTKLLSTNSRVCLGILMADGRRFVFELAWRPTDDPLWSVDAYVCEELVLKKILQKKGEVNVKYDHEALSIEKKLVAGEGCLAVVLSSPKLESIWKVANEGEKMPKKSTYFYPKIWSGFVSYLMR
ncbi:MAG: DUF1015 domain-containing protein [Methanomassiliicoccales archaeon]|jgi:uncharacterized protein (DUF1015 family)|nr:DUF1015 domain-containing protein [Methanomassiliicoccales archaeon]